MIFPDRDEDLAPFPWPEDWFEELQQIGRMLLTASGEAWSECSEGDSNDLSRSG
jgi:hypothetical protein